MLLQVLIELLGILPMMVLVGIVIWRSKQLDRDDRRDPLTTELRSLPGSSLQEQIDSMADSRLEKLVVALTAGLVVALLVALRRMDASARNLDALDGIAVLVSVGIAIYLGLQIIREMPRARRLRQAIRAEHATAQELAGALAGDNRVIHDVQAAGFNIDHVVISPAGVFAVETKSRLKPPAGSGAPKVRYDGKQLEFPGWTETKPIEQAMRQAKWLSDYLSKTTGDKFSVTAVVALPGWFVENTARITEGMVRVINPKKSQWLFLPDRQQVRLDPASIQRAASAIERLAQAPPN